MAKGSPDTLSRVASCADYDSDEGEEVNGTRKQANIAAKRSGGLAKVDLSAMSPEPLQHPVIPDLQSDSGYSSRTQATAASADSGLSAKIAAAAAAAAVASAGSEIHTVSSTASSGTRKTATAPKKKTKKCTDPNCKHRGRSSKTSSTTSPSKPKAKSPPPPPRQASLKRRARIDTPESESRQQRPQRPQRPSLRPNASSSQAQSRSYHPGMAYPIDPRIAAAYPRGPYPMGPAGYTMHVNRQMPQRPPMHHLATDMSARKINPRAAYGAQPVVVQQAKSNIVHSARALPKSAKVPHPHDDEDDFDDDTDDSDEDSELEEEEEEEDPRALLIQNARLKQYQELRKQQYEMQVLEQRKQQAQQALRVQQAQQAQAMLAAQKAKEEAARVAMPPPPRPSSAMNPGYSMRRTRNEPSPMITYSDQLGQQISQAFNASTRPRPTPTGGAKAPSYPVVTPGSRANYATDEAIRHKRRGSVYGSESIAEIEARERALANRFEELERQKEDLRRQRRQSHGATPGYDSQALRAQLQNLSLAGNDRSKAAAGMSKTLDEATSYIERRRDSSSQPQLTTGILRKHGLDRDNTSSRSKRSSRDDSSSAGNRRRASIVDPEEKYDGDGLKMRVDTKQDYEIEIGNHRIELRPNDEGTIDLYVGGTRENRYHSSKASSAGASKISRRMSRRARIVEDESLSEESDEDEEYDTPRERASVRGGAARRRAETISTYESEPRRRESFKLPASAERPKRSALRRPAYEEVNRPLRGEYRRPGTPEQEHYRGPPIYGAAPDEYPRFTQGYGRYEPPSPQPPHGYGARNQNFQGFGG